MTDTEKLPTVCVVLGRSQEHPRSEFSGVSEVQRRSRIRICSHSKWRQSRDASCQRNQSRLTRGLGTEHRCLGPFSTQWPQPGDLPGTCLCPGTQACGMLAGFPGVACPSLACVVGILPQRLLAARHGVGLTDVATAALSLERPYGSLPRLDGVGGPA